MQAANPIEIDGQIFDKISLNLAVTTKYLEDGTRDMSIALRVIPTRISEGEGVVTADNAAKGLFRGRIAEIEDPAELQAVAAMTQAMQALLTAKGF